MGGRAKRGEIRRHSRQAKTTFIDNVDADCGPVLNTQPAKSLKVNAMYTSSHITTFHAHLSACNVQSGWTIKPVLWAARSSAPLALGDAFLNIAAGEMSDHLTSEK